MSYRNGSWSARKDKLGDEAEGKFMEWCERNDVVYERFGFDHSELDVAHLPRRIRYRPDFLTNKKLVECIGLGRDQKAKLAIYKWNVLEYWNTVHPVDLYVWDRQKKRETFVPLETWDRLVDELKADLASFPEKKAYWSVPADAIFG
jgi:hypothetical protein